MRRNVRFTLTIKLEAYFTVNIDNSRLNQFDTIQYAVKPDVLFKNCGGRGIGLERHHQDLRTTSTPYCHCVQTDEGTYIDEYVPGPNLMHQVSPHLRLVNF